MNILRIKETCIYVSDLERTRAFYSGQLGLPVLSLVAGQHIFFRAGSSVLLCFMASFTRVQTGLPAHGAEGSIHFAFEVSKEDYSKAAQAIESGGVPILHQQVWKNGLRSFYFHDPDGHLLEILEEGVWER